jgi:hypothetical protein
MRSEATTQFKTLVLATLAALAIQPLVLLFMLVWTASLNTTWVEPGQMVQTVLVALLVATGFIVVFFWPTFFVLRRLGWFNRASAALAGFVISGAPALLACFIGRSFSGVSYQSTWHGQTIQMVANNQVTTAGFLLYAELVVLTGLHGLAGALAFHYVWRRRIGD